MSVSRTPTSTRTVVSDRPDEAPETTAALGAATSGEGCRSRCRWSSAMKAAWSSSPLGTGSAGGEGLGRRRAVADGAVAVALLVLAVAVAVASNRRLGNGAAAELGDEIAELSREASELVGRVQRLDGAIGRGL